MKKQYVVLLAGAVMLVVFIAAKQFYGARKTSEIGELAFENASVLVRDYSPQQGSADARVTIVEFFDPLCETCRTFYPAVHQLMEEHPGKIRLVLRYTPFHDGADYVVRILEAARMQGKFWEVLEATFASQPQWASHTHAQPGKLWGHLGQTGLDIEQARRDMYDEEINEHIRQDLADAKRLGVTKTPGFFVNGKPLVQFGYEPLKTLVDSEVRNNY
jgi:protein-disulfide isomerase